MNIEENLKDFLAKRTPEGRYTSFDYCFNYFQSYRESGNLPSLARGSNLQLSCLHLGFFLASWGMFRRDFLLSKSVRYFAKVVEAIASSSPSIWTIDAHCYFDDTNWQTLEDWANKIWQKLPATDRDASETLVTKIMLGVFGCVPAFDSRFKRGFQVSRLALPSLQKIADFYRDNKEIVEKHRVETLDFETGSETKRKYTRAKVIDMIFFIEGAARPKKEDAIGDRDRHPEGGDSQRLRERSE